MRTPEEQSDCTRKRYRARSSRSPIPIDVSPTRMPIATRTGGRIRLLSNEYFTKNATPRNASTAPIQAKSLTPRKSSNRNPVEAVGSGFQSESLAARGGGSGSRGTDGTMLGRTGGGGGGSAGAGRGGDGGASLLRSAADCRGVFGALDFSSLASRFSSSSNRDRWDSDMTKTTNGRTRKPKPRSPRRSPPQPSIAPSALGPEARHRARECTSNYPPGTAQRGYQRLLTRPFKEGEKAFAQGQE